ncbi:BnaA07g07640D [Brassica napus]|uniref:(rape) hypothetical protein n=1 Tax=Brassica napus TaxID=3708 RepID=A0A078HXF3_BRANA|nr:unnamed protein product [Brassica napus]CDY43190.1 BnaA07g07640D [Brassica napus]
MSASSSSFSSLVIIFILVLLCPLLSSSSEPEPKCCKMRTRSQCSGFPRCRWCRSEALDDLCFSKAEALRLPSQVFRC